LAPGFLHFVAFPSQGRRALPKVAPTRQTTQESQMITAFFAFATIGFFVSIVAHAVESVSTKPAFA